MQVLELWSISDGGYRALFEANVVLAFPYLEKAVKKSALLDHDYIFDVKFKIIEVVKIPVKYFRRALDEGTFHR